MNLNTLFDDTPEHIPSENIWRFGGQVKNSIRALLETKADRPAPVPCQATWTKSTAPWLKKERARIEAEIAASKRGTK